MSPKSGARYSEEFKQQIVDLFHASKSVSELSGEYGVATVQSINGYIINLQ